MQQYLGLIYAIAAYTWWGIVPIYWKWLDHVPAHEIVTHRMVWSFVLVTLLILVMGQGKELRAQFKDKRTIFTLGLASTFVTINWAIFIWAVNSGYLLETSLGYFINPLVTVLFGVLLFGERLRSWQLLALALAAIGGLIFVYALGRPPWIALSLALTFALYSVMKKKVSVPATHGMSIETLFFLLPAVGYLIYLNLQGTGSFTVDPNADVLTAFLLVLGGLFTLVPLILFAAAAKRETLVTLGMTQYIGPTLQFLIAVFMFNEALGQTRLIGFGFIWLALIVYSIDLVRQARIRRRQRLSKSAAAT